MIISVMVVSTVVLGGGLATDNYAFLEKWATGNTLSYVAPEIVYAAELQSMSKDNIEEEKWRVVDELAQCECGGHTWDEGFFRLDSNDKYSWGCLQFQQSTVVHYVKKLWGEVIDGARAKIIALDRELARKLAYDVIFKTDKGVASDWVNCSKWHKLQERVDMIKRIETQ